MYKSLKKMKKKQEKDLQMHSYKKKRNPSHYVAGFDLFLKPT